MTFNAWWNTLSPKEQAVIGENNARFVWKQACNACCTLLEGMHEVTTGEHNYYGFAARSLRDLMDINDD